MRVLVAAATPPWPLTDGSSLVLNHQLRHLAGRHEITVLAAGRPTGGREPEPAEIGLGDEVAIRWFGSSAGRLTGYLRRRVAGAAAHEPADVFAVELPELVTAFDELAPEADIVHLHGWGTARLAARTATPAVHAPIDAWQRGFGEQRALPPWRRLLEVGERRRVMRHERRHYPRCAAVVVVAPRDAEVLRSAAPGARVEVLPNGVDVGPPPPGPSNAPVLGFHGVLSTVANEAAALVLVDEVLPRVQARHPAARVLLVGKDPGPALRRREGEVVRVTGPVDDVRVHLADVGVYVAAFRRGSGLKNKVLEAMAAGLPVVATDRAVDGIACTAPVVANDADGLAHAAGELLADDAARRRLGAAGRRCAERSSWAANAETLEQLWRDAATGRR